MEIFGEGPNNNSKSRIYLRAINCSGMVTLFACVFGVYIIVDTSRYVKITEALIIPLHVSSI